MAKQWNEHKNTQRQQISFIFHLINTGTKLKSEGRAQKDTNHVYAKPEFQLPLVQVGYAQEIKRPDETADIRTNLCLLPG